MHVVLSPSKYSAICGAVTCIATPTIKFVQVCRVHRELVETVVTASGENLDSLVRPVILVLKVLLGLLDIVILQHALPMRGDPQNTKVS